jgi:ketoreductase RED2
VAIVTGSTEGIGRAVARSLASEGARIIVNSVRSIDEGRRLAESLPEAAYVQGDISQTADVDRIISAAIERWGRLDIVVNNAGATKVIPHSDIDAATLEVWRMIFDVNVLGTWYVCQQAMSWLQKQGGSIVNITSLSAEHCTGSSIPYAVSKAGLNHMTRLLARVAGPMVRVNAVAPGLVDTRWTADWDDARARVQESAPLRRSASPEDIADAVAYLCAGAGYTTGQILTVDGGVSLSGLA